MSMTNKVRYAMKRTFYQIVWKEKALEDGSTTAGETTASTADGEGFDLKVYREEDDAYWDKATLPYTDQTCFNDRDDAVGPWDLFRKYRK